MSLTIPEADASRLVILPSYNSGSLLTRTACEVLKVWKPVHVIIDGSTDGSAEEVRAISDDGLKVRILEKNGGKGEASLVAMREALNAGFTHALIMDADGQHPVDQIRPFMELSKKHPEAMILGVPIFGSDAPVERVKGRRVGNAFAEIETLGGGIRDSLFGFRLYPLAASVRIMESISTARGFDFDTELAVRLFWSGVRPINVPVRVFYPKREAGGVTHFRYLRHNLLLAGTHTRLCLGMILRIAKIWTLRQKWLKENS